MVSVAFGIICNNARVTAGIAASVISGLDCKEAITTAFPVGRL